MHTECNCSFQLTPITSLYYRHQLKHGRLWVLKHNQWNKKQKGSDVKHCLFMERLCIQSSNPRNFTLRILDKAAYIFKFLLQFIVLTQLSVQCLPSSKRIQKNRFGLYLQEHVISELSKLRDSGGEAALTKADMLVP